MKKMFTILAMLLFTSAMALAQTERNLVIHGDDFQSAGAISLELSTPGPEEKLVKNVPLSADVVNTHVQYLQDGNKITNEDTSHFYRDSEGRTRRENKLMLPGHDGDGPSMISINDPVAHTRFVLNTVRKSADAISVETHRAETIVKSGTGKGNVMFFQKNADEAAAKGTGEPETKEDLGTQTIEGVSAHGTRSSHVIAPGKIGNERAITVTTESWYSDDLGMEVLRIHKDPWAGEVTTKVTNVRRGEPDASLFTPPHDYKVDVLKGGQNRVIHIESNDSDEQLPTPPRD